MFDKERSLSSLEISQLTNNYQSTELFHEILRSFIHTKNNEICKHFERGKDICANQLNTIQDKLEEELPQLPMWESEIDRELPSPFSAQLMLFKVALLAGATTGQYGASASSKFRRFFYKDDESDDVVCGGYR
ncbi:DUF3231 family protein [Paraliobacillus zengyii]|uniref:DUF3231 family protein n=1 Tax=Paraliobacillus zengyii TaxID=2213194 RepID=UPI000E3B9E60|nr:DUF3231 family protein [Paraliobacillus zengyii]